MNPFQAIFRAVAPILRPLVNVVNAVVQAVAPRTDFAQSVQQVTNTVNQWTAPSQAQQPPGVPARGGSGTTHVGDAPTPAGGTVSSATQPAVSAAEQHRLDLEAQAQAFDKNAGMTLTSGGDRQPELVFNPINALLTYAFAEVDEYFTPVAAKLKNLNDTRIKIFLDMIFANDGDISRAAEQTFADIRADGMSQTDIDAVRKIVTLAQTHQEVAVARMNLTQRDLSSRNSAYFAFNGNGKTPSLSGERRFSQDQTATSEPSPLDNFDPTRPNEVPKTMEDETGKERPFLEVVAEIANNPNASEDQRMKAQAIVLQLKYGVTVTVNPTATVPGTMSWKEFLSSQGSGIRADEVKYLSERMYNIYQAVQITEEAFRDQNFINQLPAYIRGIGDYTEGALFKFLMGDVNIQLTGGSAGSVTSGNNILLRDATYPEAPNPDEYIIPIHLVIHELGHVFHNQFNVVPDVGGDKEYVLQRFSRELSPNESQAGGWDETGLNPHSKSLLLTYGNAEKYREQFANWFQFWVYDRYLTNVGIPSLSKPDTSLTQDIDRVGGIDQSNPPGQRRERILTEYLADQVAILYGRRNRRALLAAVQQITDEPMKPITLIPSTDEGGSPTVNIQEHPSIQNTIESNGQNVSNAILLQINESSRMNAIGKITVRTDIVWVLVEVNGNIGWILASQINEPDALGLKNLTTSDVEKLTGTTYTDNTQWVPQPTGI
jgi:hypothetical protein